MVNAGELARANRTSRAAGRLIYWTFLQTPPVGVPTYVSETGTAAVDLFDHQDAALSGYPSIWNTPTDPLRCELSAQMRSSRTDRGNACYFEPTPDQPQIDLLVVWLPR